MARMKEISLSDVENAPELPESVDESMARFEALSAKVQAQAPLTGAEKQVLERIAENMVYLAKLFASPDAEHLTMDSLRHTVDLLARRTHPDYDLNRFEPARVGSPSLTPAMALAVLSQARPLAPGSAKETTPQGGRRRRR